MTQLADAPINLVSLADPLLAEIFEYVGTPGVGKLALTCTGGPDLEHNVIADQINESFCGRGCTCLICPKREIRMNPKIDDEFD